MLGSRAKIVLLTSFFTFTFALMFFALVQNYAHAGVTSLVTDHSGGTVATTGIQSSIDHEIVPSFGVHHQEVSFDFDRDDSFQKYLSPDHPLHDTDYVPTDLVPIDSNFTANDSRSFKLRQEASIYFADMAWHFRHAFSGDRLYISSAYRSI